LKPSSQEEELSNEQDGTTIISTTQGKFVIALALARVGRNPKMFSRDRNPPNLRNENYSLKHVNSSICWPLFHKEKKM
jgi:hypothetical protein